MDHKAKSIRPFLGAKNFELSRNFYRDLGFNESILSHNLSYFETDGLGFYLQDAYVPDWVDNSMVFLEVEDVGRYWRELLTLDLTSRYESVKLTPVRELDWGRECFIHDPSGILWHIGEFFLPEKKQRNLLKNKCNYLNNNCYVIVTHSDEIVNNLVF